ncbi:MAG: DUF4129 domain-containing protein [Armatimonadota bacterium]|nr:DUF4129 domain-containing protein [Armatimonadota bacterium]MDR7457649.1 DUF4129 domain-containing protein [Armatimonadota bacterium]MDR7497882.1 DUF4129 domain-containing protein [Armatimonadota bacterium]MDR7512157.1 DUF4129 domain-containing protein [Armatimonadota bacterium]
MLPTVRAAMEFCWLYPWLVVLGGAFYGPTGPLLAPGRALLMLVGAQVLARPVLDRVAPVERARAALVTVGLVAGLAAVHAQYYAATPPWDPAWLGALLVAVHDVLPTVPKPVAGALAATLLWWRGLVLGTREADAAAIEDAYKTGVAMIVLYFLGAIVYGDSRAFAAAGGTLPASMPAFFFLGLSALALARLSLIWDRGRLDERARFPARAWTLLIVGVVGLILLAASMSAGLAAADVATYVGIALQPLLPLVEAVFIVLLFFAQILARIIVAVLSRLPRLGPRGDEIPPAAVFDDLLRRLRELQVAPTVIEGARWGMVVAALALLVLGMAVTIVLLRRQRRSADDDEHESVWSTREALRGLGRLLGRVRPSRRPAEERALPVVVAVRRIYREVLRVGAQAGAPRHPASTPREHAPRLEGALPAAAEAIAAVTVLYERVRYGAWRPPAPDLAAAEEALRVIREAASPRGGEARKGGSR